MIGNDNVIRIKTNDEDAKRKILEVIEDDIEVTILLTEEPLELQASIYNDTIIDIIRKIIMEDMLEVVSMYPVKAKEKQENKKDEEDVSTKNVEERKVETAKKTIKERILSYMLPKEQVTNAEIIKSLQLRADQVNKELTALCKCGKIEKIGRGQWKIKDTKENHVLGSEQNQQDMAKVVEPVNEEQSLIKEKETKENSQQKQNPNSQEKLQKEIYNFVRAKQQVKNKEIIEKFALEAWRVSNILKNLEKEGKIQKLGFGTWKVNQTLEQQILDLLAKGWQMTKEEIAEKIGLEDMESLEELLNSMEMEKKITREEDNYKIWKSQFGIFDIEENRILLDYIMEHTNFTTSQIKSKFPEEYSKLPKLLEELEKKYVTPRKDTIGGGYVVHNKGRVLYFIMKHPGTTFSIIKEHFKLIKSQDISNAINIAVRNGELKRNKYGGYHTLKM